MTPDNTQLYNEKGNAGRYIVNKNIAKIGDLGLRNNIFSSNSSQAQESARYVIDKDGNIVERRKKRMCSLGGNEPKKQSHLVRLKTVGTFDLCMEVTALACGFNEKMLNDTVTTNMTPPLIIPAPQPLQQQQQQHVDADLDRCCSTSIPRIKHISLSVNSLTKLTDFDFLKNQSQQSSQSLCTSSYAINGNVTHFNELDLIKHKLITGDSIFKKLNKKSSLVCNNYNTDTVLPHQHLYINNNVDKHAIATTSDIFEAVHCESFDISKIRQRTFKKCNRIIRTDSDLFKDTTPVYGDEVCSKDGSFDEMDNNSKDNLSNEDLYDLKTSTEEESVKNISTDTVFSDTCDPVDLEKLENEYKEHIRASLQREYKSDGSIDSLDEVGKKRYQFGKWKNQSVDFNFLDDEDNDKDVGKESEAESQDVDMDVFSTSPVKFRKDDDNRTKSEGDYELEMEQRDSFETQESTEEESDKFPNAKTRHDSDEIKSEDELEPPQTLFEKRFGKFKKINKLLKVKRYSTSALYDKKKADEKNLNASRTKGSSNPSASPSKGNLSASKTSLSSPKSVQEKKNIFKKRKFSFFGKSQSNNDLNINLKSIASKISLLSKSNFDLSNKKLASNLKLNDVGIAGKYGASNEYRSDILVNEPTSPLNEGFYNPTGSYQLSAMELFEKFCSQDFTGLYKHEAGFEAPEEDNVDNNDAGSWSYTGAIKKSISLRKSALMKQCSEPRFGLKNHHHMSDDYSYNREDAFEEELENQEYNDDAIDVKLNHHNSYCLQTQNVFEEEEDYFEDNEDGEYFVNGQHNLTNEPIYFQPELHRETIEITGTDDSAEIEHSTDYVQICAPDTDDIDYEGSQSDGEGGDENLKTIISDYVKNALASGEQSGLTRTKSVELLSNSSDTIRSNSNSEYAFDTVKHLHLDSCNTSRLSLSLKSDIFDDVSFSLPLENNNNNNNNVKTIQICEMDDFTLTPDGSMSCSDNFTIDEHGVVVKNELTSQYTIIDFDDELRHDDEEKSSFAEALNKEFDKLFSRIDESDTDVTTPSCTTIVTAVKIPSRCSMEKLEPYSTDAISDNNVNNDTIVSRDNPNPKLMSQSMTSTVPLEQLLIPKKDDFAGKSKRSHSLGNIHKRKSNKCNPL